MSAPLPLELQEPMLRLFESVGNSVLIGIAKHLNSIEIFTNGTLSKEAKHCANVVRHKPVKFQYKIVQSLHWKVAVSGIPHDLICIRSLSQAVPRYAWTNRAMHCLHLLYHAQNATILDSINTKEDINVAMEIDKGMHKSIMKMTSPRNAPKQLKNMMHEVWMKLMGFGGLCETKSTEEPCTIKGYWSVKDLNSRDQNDVPNLICNKNYCIHSQSPFEFELNRNKKTRTSAHDMLLTSGWAYKVHSVSDTPSNSRSLFDWYKFCYEHFHLGWFQLHYKKNEVQRVQLFSITKRKSDVAVIRRANVFIASFIFVVNALFVWICIWSFL